MILALSATNGQNMCMLKVSGCNKGDQNSGLVTGTVFFRGWRGSFSSFELLCIYYSYYIVLLQGYTILRPRLNIAKLI